MTEVLPWLWLLALVSTFGIAISEDGRSVDETNRKNLFQMVVASNITAIIIFLASR